jgi:hypothetical protein
VKRPQQHDRAHTRQQRSARRLEDLHAPLPQPSEPVQDSVNPKRDGEVGTAMPAEYTDSNAAPWVADPLVAASAGALPMIGPMHGVPMKANTKPNGSPPIGPGCPVGCQGR